MAKSENAASHENTESGVSRKLLLVFIAGLLTILIGITVLIVATALYGGSTSFGVVIFLWFIPIVVGAGPEATVMTIIAIVLAVLSIIIFLIMHKRLGKAEA